MHNQFNYTFHGTTSHSQYDHHSFFTAPLKRQTTEEIMDDIVDALLQTNEDVQSYTEDCKKRKFSHENNHSSSSHSTKKIKTRVKKEESIQNSDLLNDDVIVNDEKINKEEARKERNRQSASAFRARQSKHIEELEQLQNATLILGKKLSKTVQSVLPIPILKNEDIDPTPTTASRFDVEICEKQYESIRKTQLWIENTVTSLVENTFEKEETFKEQQTRIMKLAHVIANLQAENDLLLSENKQLRRHGTLQHPSNASDVARVSAGGIDS